MNAAQPASPNGPGFQHLRPAPLGTIKDAQARGALAADFPQNHRTKALLTQDRKVSRLPAELRARLLKGEYGT